MAPRTVFGIWVSLFAVICIIRTFVFVGIGADESEALILAQEWRLGYGPINPPLFVWLLIPALELFGVDIGVVIALRFLILTGACSFLYLSARHILQDTALAALAALTPVAIYYFAWDSLFHYSHSALLTLAVTGALYAFLRLEAKRDLGSYILFGLALGLGMLSKYNFGLFAAALVAAALFEYEFRQCLLDRRIGLSLLIMVAVAAPHFIWLADHLAAFESHVSGRFNLGAGASIVSRTDAAVTTITSAVSFLLPAALLLLIFFPRAFLTNGAAAEANGRYRRVLQRLFLIMVVVMALAVFLLGVSGIRTHYMFLLIPFPVYAFVRIHAVQPHPRALNLYAAVLLALVVLLPLAAAAKFAIDPQRGSKARYNVPYEVFAAQFRKAGFDKGTILGDWLTYPVAGNLRPYFPDSRVVSLLNFEEKAYAHEKREPFLPPRGKDAGGMCLVVWTPRSDLGRVASIVKFMNGLFGTRLESADVEPKFITAKMPPSSGRTVTLAYLLFGEGAGNCN